MEKEVNIYRVRKSFFDLKHQYGAFLSLENAIRLAKKLKLNVYDNNGDCLWEGGGKVEKSI